MFHVKRGGDGYFRRQDRHGDFRLRPYRRKLRCGGRNILQYFPGRVFGRLISLRHVRDVGEQEQSCLGAGILQAGLQRSDFRRVLDKADDHAGTKMFEAMAKECIPYIQWPGGDILFFPAQMAANGFLNFPKESKARGWGRQAQIRSQAWIGPQGAHRALFLVKQREKIWRNGVIIWNFLRIIYF